MAQLLVRNIDDSVKSRLRRRAARHGHSMEEEVRDILRDAVKNEESTAGGLGTRISARFRKIGLKKELPELRGHKIKPPTFES
jgi:plasmid stability protein